jgi:hypothetical protein
MLGQLHVVVGEEHRVLTHLRAANESHPLTDHCLANLVVGVRLPGQDQLHRTLRMGQQADQPLRIVQEQVRPLVTHEATSEPQRQGVAIQYVAGIFQRLRPGPSRRKLPGQPRRAWSISGALAAVRNSQRRASETQPMSSPKVPTMGIHNGKSSLPLVGDRFVNGWGCLLSEADNRVIYGGWEPQSTAPPRTGRADAVP